MTKILQFIGKGQVTIPQEWRAVLGLEDKAIKATLQGDKIILEPLPLKEEKEWKVEYISLNTLPKSDKKLILQARKAYKKGKKGKFLGASEFFRI